MPQEPQEPEEFYSDYAKKQDEQYRLEDLSDEFVELRRTFCELVSEGRVLDVGCGSGRDTNFFASEGFEAVGIDVAEGMVSYAKKHRDGEFHRMDMRDMKLEDASVDGIWCSAAIFFVPPEDRKPVMEEFYRVLAENGVLFVSSKIGEGQYVKEKWGNKVIEYRMQPEEFFNILTDAGFEVVQKGESGSSTDKNFVNCFCRKT